MEYTSCIVLSSEARRGEIAMYEAGLPSMSLSEKLRDAQLLSEMGDDISNAKVLLLYLSGEREISHEVRRIFSWTGKKEKSEFLIDQLKADENELVLASIELLGVLQEPSSIPALDDVFDISNAKLCMTVIEALNKINHPLGTRTMKKALKAPNELIVVFAVQKLARWTETVPWKVFLPLLFQKNAEITAEAAFAIALRRSPKSAKWILRVIYREPDKLVRRNLIRFLGMIPSSLSVLPLLKIMTTDPDQKARLAASRAMDRLQGLISPRVLFHFRRIPDVKMRAELIVRLGKFSSDIERHKEFIRETLVKSDDMLITQACIQALGSISDRGDIALLETLLSKDPLTSYQATLALTRIWRLSDAEHVLEILRTSVYPVQKQVIMKYLMRRRGFSTNPFRLLETVADVLSKDDNVNVHYLGACLLRYAPSAETVDYLLNLYVEETDPNIQSATDNSLNIIATYHSDYLLELMKVCGRDTCRLLFKHIPPDLDASFYRSAAKTVFTKYAEFKKDAGATELCSEVFARFSEIPQAFRELVRALPDAELKKHFLDMFSRTLNEKAIGYVKNELVDMLDEEDGEIRRMTLELLTRIKDPSVLPLVIEAVHKDKGGGLKPLAQEMSRQIIREGIL